MSQVRVWALTTRSSGKHTKYMYEASVPPFSSPEPTIPLACGWDRELWPDPISWACAEYSFSIVNQSDLLDLTGSPWIAEFRCWTKPELWIPTTGRRDRRLWGRECCTSTFEVVPICNCDLYSSSVYEIKLGTVDQNEADVEWRLRPYMNTSKKRKMLSS